jgi:hypothetical protein
MWCANSDYFPYAWYNWIVPAYPGDDYVDIVATDIYNNHYPVTFPWWRSFRWQATESYYYLTKYFPQKPLFICEVGCRERFDSENKESESKGQWYARMDKEMQSNFRKARALVFFNAFPDQNWLVNSSPGALQSLIDNIWYDNYYFSNSDPMTVKENEYGGGLYVYPNPNNGFVTFSFNSETPKENFTIKVTNVNGQVVYSDAIKLKTESFTKVIDLSTLAKGIYLVELQATQASNKQGDYKQIRKMVIQ